MTKFILHGGATGKPVASNKKFFKESLAGLGKKAKVLIVYYARKKKDYPWMFEQDINNFKLNSPLKDIKLEIADSKPQEFKKQLQLADVIYARGGNTLPLLKKIKQLPDFVKLIKNKVYAGSSAGMYLVSKYYWSTDRKKIEQGLGILPIKSFAHWDKSNQAQLLKLKNFKENLPIYKVPEGKFIVIKK